MNEATQKKQTQLRQNSGNVRTPNIDDHSLYCLQDSQEYHQHRGNPFSQSCIVRRSLRAYQNMLMRMDQTAYEMKLVEIRRAAKGVL